MHSSSLKSNKKSFKVKDSLEIIDHAMNMHQSLYEFTGILNSYFRFQLLVVICLAFIDIVFDSYYVLEVLNNPHKGKY